MVVLALVTHLFIRFFIFLLFARAIISWVAPMNRHPVILALIRVTDPPLEPIRNMIGIQSGIDFSPLIAMVLLSLIDGLLIRLV